MKRLALVVGIANYRSSPLSNPVRDARLVDKALSSRGFNCTRLEDPGGIEFDHALEAFSKLARGSCFSLIYFAGHGFEANGAGYVLPADFPFPPRASILRQCALPITKLLESMSEGLGPKVPVLDTCRTGFDAWDAKEWARTTPDLQAMRESMGYDDVLIAYSTSAGDIAFDGAGTSSRYCDSFCKNVALHKLSLEDCFKEIGLSIMAPVTHRQRPWYYSNLVRPARFSDLPRFQLVQSFLIPGREPGAILALSGSPAKPDLLACVGTKNVYRVRSPTVGIVASIKDGTVVGATPLSDGGLALVDREAVLHFGSRRYSVSVQTKCRKPYGIGASNDGTIVAIYGIDSFSVFAIEQSRFRCLIHRRTRWSPYCSLFVDPETVWFSGSGGHIVEVSKIRGTPKIRRIPCSRYLHIYSAALCTDTSEVVLTTGRGEIMVYDVESRKLRRTIELPTSVQTTAARRDSLLNYASNDLIETFLFSPDSLSEEERDYCLKKVARNELLFASHAKKLPILAVANNEGLV